jgi:regulator of protease activity HflC (stomatin/prohibitin superfamily)
MNLKSVGLVLSLAMGLTGCGCTQVNEGNRGIKTNFGKMEGEPLSPGLHWYNPMTEGIIEMDVREQVIKEATDVFTRDTQKVSVTYAVSFYPQVDKIGYLYSQFGTDWHQKVIPQVVLGGLKDAIGKYIADDLVGKREESKLAAQKEITDALASRAVVVTRLDIINLDFDDGYEKAVEEKVVAIQKAQEAKNKTVQVEEEAKQKLKAAEADAESMRIKSQALSQNQNLVNYELVQKWNGVLPTTVMGGSIPLLNVDKLMSGK